MRPRSKSIDLITLPSLLLSPSILQNVVVQWYYLGGWDVLRRISFVGPCPRLRCQCHWSFGRKEVDDIVYEVDCQMITVKAGADVDIGSSKQSSKTCTVSINLVEKVPTLLPKNMKRRWKMARNRLITSSTLSVSNRRSSIKNPIWLTSRSDKLLSSIWRDSTCLFTGVHESCQGKINRNQTWTCRGFRKGRSSVCKENCCQLQRLWIRRNLTINVAA